MPEATELEPGAPMTPVIFAREARKLRDKRRAKHGTPIDLGALVALVPDIAEILRGSDEVLRIVGSKELLDGVRRGTLRYMQGELGHTTTVLDQQGRIVGHVQLQPADTASAFAPAAAMFQIASAITLQYYLQRFDERLTDILKSVKDSREHAAWAQIGRAALETAEIAELLQRDGSLTQDLRARLDAEERAVDVVVLQELIPVQAAIRSLETVRREIDETLTAANEKSKVAHAVNVVKDTLPGGLRQKLQRSLDDLQDAMVHWNLAARAAQVHASLRMLRAIDDRVKGREQTDAAQRAVTERAHAQAQLGERVCELLTLPVETFDMFGIDSRVQKRVAAVSTMAATLRGESDSAAQRLGIAATDPPTEILVTMHDGNVVVLPTRKAVA